MSYSIVMSTKEAQPRIREQVKAAYLDYVNNYLTLDLFAEHNGLSIEEAQDLIAMGGAWHEADCEQYRASKKS